MQPKFRINRITGLEIVRGGPKFYTDTHTLTDTQTHTHTDTHTHRHTHTDTHTHTHTHTDTHTQTHTHTDTHTHTHRHTHTGCPLYVFFFQKRNKTKKGNMFKAKTLIEKGVPGISTSCPEQHSRQLLTTASTFPYSSKNCSAEHIHAFLLCMSLFSWVWVWVSERVSEYLCLYEWEYDLVNEWERELVSIFVRVRHYLNTKFQWSKSNIIGIMSFKNFPW